MSPQRPRSLRQWQQANRNLCLFVAMLAIVVMLPAFEDSKTGEILFAAINTFTILVALAACGGARRLFRLAVLLAVPAAVLRAMAFFHIHAACLTWSWVFCAGIMVLTIIRLLRGMFEEGKVTRERLFACATTYLVIGLLWCYLYAIAMEVAPNSFTGLSANRGLHVADMAYFSFNIVTSVALTSVLPVSKTAQMLVILQEFVSVLYMAFVISRLVGMYAPERTDADEPAAPSRPSGTPH